METATCPAARPKAAGGAGHRRLAGCPSDSFRMGTRGGGRCEKKTLLLQVTTCARSKSFSPLITREPIFSFHLVPSRPARPAIDGWRMAPGHRVAVSGMAPGGPSGLPAHRPSPSSTFDPSRQSFPGPEGSPTSPAKARHVTETGLVGHTANKHQPRDGVIPLGKVLSRPWPSGFCCCMALQRVRIRGRSEGKAACLGRWGTQAVMAELALGPGDRRGATRTTTSRCLPKTEAAGHQMTRVGEPFSKGQKPGCLCIFRWNPDGRAYGVQEWFLLEMAPGGEAASRERSSGRRGLVDRVRVCLGLGARRSAIFNSPE